MTERELGGTLAQIADEVVVVDLGPRVRARAARLRRRRTVAVVALPVAAAVGVAALLVAPPDASTAPPTGPRQVPTVELSESSRSPLGRAAVLGVVDSASGAAWVVTDGGRVSTVSGPAVAPVPGAPPVLSAGGSVLSFGDGDGDGGVVRALSTIDGTSTEAPAPGGQDNLVSMSPDGRTAAYAVESAVGAIDLTILPMDGGTPTTVPVTIDSASGVLVPVVWSDDGTAVLVLEGRGATRVTLGPEPRAGQGVHLEDQLALAYGWAASPDLSRFVMGADREISGGRRQWQVLDTESGRAVEVISRPVADRLIGWTAGDRLVWWLPTAYGYTVVSTDTAGRAARAELRVMTDLPNLVAAWREDGS